MFRFPLFIAMTLIIAFGGGIMISLYALDATAGFGAIKLGAWEAFPELQTERCRPLCEIAPGACRAPALWKRRRPDVHRQGRTMRAIG